MYCEKCGAKLEDHFRFCEKCGAPVLLEEIPDPATPMNRMKAMQLQSVQADSSESNTLELPVQRNETESQSAPVLIPEPIFTRGTDRSDDSRDPDRE